MGPFFGFKVINCLFKWNMRAQKPLNWSNFLVPPPKRMHSYDMRTYDSTVYSTVKSPRVISMHMYTAVGHCLKKKKTLSIYSRQLVWSNNLIIRQGCPATAAAFWYLNSVCVPQDKYAIKWILKYICTFCVIFTKALYIVFIT